MVPNKAKRLSVRRPLVVAAIAVGLSAATWTVGGIYLFWNDPKLVNFMAAWIPAVISVLIAFVPEREMTPVKKWAWRSSVIAAGFIWSIVLWHQQVITEIAAKNDQRTIVTQAVTQSNEHSDQKIGEVRKDVQGVKADLQGTKQDLENKISDTISKSTSSLNASIGKVGKPEAPEAAKLEATLWDEKAKILPVRSLTVKPNLDGVFPVEWTFRNVSGAAAVDSDIWIQLCTDCEFASEPEGFDRPKGMDEYTRHHIAHLLNPWAVSEKITTPVKLKRVVQKFEIAFHYSCQACDKQSLEPQRLTIINGVGLNLGTDTKPTLKLPQ